MDFKHSPTGRTVPPAFATVQTRAVPVPAQDIDAVRNRLMTDLKANHNVFITGAAGTGKSTLLRAAVHMLRGLGRTCAVTATTGVAAVEIGGQTLHSWGGLGLLQGEPNAIVSGMHALARKRWCSTNVLVIDEVSMLSAETFTKVEAVAAAPSNECVQTVRWTASHCGR